MEEELTIFDEYMLAEELETTENTVQAPSLDTHHGPFYHDATFWVGVSFILVILLISKPVGRVLKSLMQKRIDNIISRINEAQKLKKDAEALLAEYEKRFSSTQKETNAIIESSKQEIDFIRQESISKLERDSQNKQRDAEARISSAQEKALKEITNSTSELAVKTVKKVLHKKLDSKAHDKLIEASIDLISGIKI